jgi:hypothetical protein
MSVLTSLFQIGLRVLRAALRVAAEIAITHIVERRADAIRRFHPGVVVYEGEIYWLAGVAVKP